MPISAPEPIQAGLVVLVLLLAVPPAGAAAATTLDPDRVGWTEIQMTASKLFLTADARLSQSLVPAGRLAADWLPVPRGQPVAAGEDVMQLLYEAGGLGHRTKVTLWMDPVSGAALQNAQHDVQGRLRYRTYRFTDIGAYQRTRRPVQGEAALPPAQWSQTSEGFRPYPAEQLGHTVLDPTGLLYAIAAAPLDKPGDHAEFWIFRRRALQRVRIEVAAPRDIKVDYAERWPTGAVRRSGTVQPLRLLLRGDAEPGADEEELELFGLHGRLELWMDGETRTPLQLAGDVKIIGQVTLRLASVRMR